MQLKKKIFTMLAPSGNTPKRVSATSGYRSFSAYQRLGNSAPNNIAAVTSH